MYFDCCAHEVSFLLIFTYYTSTICMYVKGGQIVLHKKEFIPKDNIRIGAPEPSFFPDGVSIIYYCPHFLQIVSSLTFCIYSSLGSRLPQGSRTSFTTLPSSAQEPSNVSMWFLQDFDVRVLFRNSSEFGSYRTK